ncbi:MAG: hypothetical protein M3R36_17740 [Bacteroidota bacterium]|nr:hypothetical protein [Bacteroidota bacterium]
MRNYSAHKYSQGNKEYVKKIFDILKFSLEKNLLTSLPEGKYMSENRFMHIAWTGLIANDFSWTEGFIKKYIYKIEPDKRQYVLSYQGTPGIRKK